MTDKPYNTLWELFESIKDYAETTGNKIESLDDHNRLLIGWICEDSYFYVRLTQIQRRAALQLPFENDEIYSLLAMLIINREGRKQIANMLNSKGTALSAFERMLRLKAFW